MNGRIYFILAMTFFTGMFLGGYLYVSVIAPEYSSDAVTDVTEISFQLRGEVYGGCQMAGVCPIFTLESNGSFVLSQESATQANESFVIKGKIKEETLQELVSVVKSANLEDLREKKTRSCRSYSDGADYRYLVTYQGKQFPLDTCGMEFGDSEISVVFQNLWQVMEGQKKDTSGGGGIQGFLKNELDERFDYDD